MGNSIYGAYANSVYKARADIRRLKNRFTVFNGLGEPPADGESGSWAPWLVPVQVEYSARNPAIENHRGLGNDERVAGAELARDQEVHQYNNAIEKLQQDLPKLRELESTGESFRSIEEVTEEFRYIVDEDAKKYYYMEQRNLAGLSEDEFDLENCITHFLGPKSIELTENETDAVRIQANNVVLRSIDIADRRDNENIAHRDGVQLIPPTQMDEDRILTDRMSGSVISNILVDNCTIDASSAILQGIFSSDGLCRNLIITNNEITTGAGHFISVAGLLDGCQISNNVLQQASDHIPQIKLFPGRLGGNIADDGIVYILSFADSGEYYYSTVQHFGNQFIGLNQEAIPDQFSDERDKIPAVHCRTALGLNNFNYDRYMETYTQSTVASYKASDPVGFRRLRAWLEQRIEEYETGERKELNRENYPILPEPSEEQQNHVINTLRPALTLLEEGTEEFLNTRVADLDSMPIRSFIIKRLAVRQGEVVLHTLGADDLESRTAQLKWFLDEELPFDQEVVPAIDEVEGGPKELPKNYGPLKIMATPVDIAQGEMITFSVNEAAYIQPGERASYYWTVKGKSGNTPQFELDSNDWAEGEHNIRATLYVRPAEGGLVRQVPGSALFVVKAPVVVEPEEPKTEKPLRAFGNIKEHIRVNHARLDSGQKLLVSLDQALIEEQQQGAKLRYYWKVKGCQASQEESYEIDTTDFDPGEHLVRVTMHRTDLETKESEQFSGIAMVEVLVVSEPA